MPFCQTAPLLSSVAWQQNLTEYWREGSASTAISTTFTSDIVGQHNKIGGITFGTAYIVWELQEFQINYFVISPVPPSLSVSYVEAFPNVFFAPSNTLYFTTLQNNS
jgi:hypothetical protein